MIKNRKIKNALALVLGASFVVGGTACSFFPTDSEKDLAQTVAKVDITDYLSETEFAQYADDVETIMSYMSTESSNKLTQISKRDLVVSFVNTGSTYINSYGYTYRQTFELLMKNLVSRKIMVQYALAYYLADETSGKTAQGCQEFIQSEQDAASGKTQELLKAHPVVSALKYFLDEEEYNTAVYTLKKALNDSLDSAETSIIKAEEEEHDHSEARTVPTRANKAKEDYLPETYEIYTGRNAADSCGPDYTRVEGSTPATRMKAYNSFLANLVSNNLISKDENTSNFLEMNYYYVELSSQLEQAIMQKFGEDLTERAEKELTLELVKNQYESDLATQQKKYAASVTDFETALGEVSDTSFVMTAPEENYGFVYNILLPFDALQNEEYTIAKNFDYSNSELHAKRAEILTRVQGKDLRGSWFSEHDHANYAYQAEDNNWYFFEDQTGANKNLEKYDTLGQYLGKYAYNGTVTIEEDGSYTAKPTAVKDIDAFIALMEGYLADSTNKTVSGAKYDNYVTYDEFTKGTAKYSVNEKGEFTDYSEFMYYTGKVEGLNFSPANFFIADEEGSEDAYTALSAFNELMFAYSTDTGCLNTYFGYAVSPFGTSFVPEFEYAAQYAIRELGVGGYVVCPSDYGWHIIYVSYVLPNGAVYGEAADITEDMLKEEGSFFNLYFESLKSASAQSYQEIVENQVLVEYNNGSCVTLYENRYEDLMSMDE
ncbi:MAG: hypothetical protein IKA72_00790 [Clostridia bacterium]|nr:hypothetical protein [Clostridia bacterium]